MINLIQKVLDSLKGGPPVSDREMQRTVSDFMTWAQVFGADDVVKAADHFMKASTAAGGETPHPAAGTISMYYVGQFLLALRKDLGQADTELTVRDLLALRITDIYESSMSEHLTKPEDAFLEAVGWTHPGLLAGPGAPVSPALAPCQMLEDSARCLVPPHPL